MSGWSISRVRVLALFLEEKPLKIVLPFNPSKNSSKIHPKNRCPSLYVQCAEGKYGGTYGGSEDARENGLEGRDRSGKEESGEKNLRRNFEELWGWKRFWNSKDDFVWPCFRRGKKDSLGKKRDSPSSFLLEKLDRIRKGMGLKARPYKE